MPTVLDNIITAAVADPKTRTVALTWPNGEKTVNRFDHLIGKGVFAALSDRKVFAQVKAGERGRSLEWPAEIDFCADALWFKTHKEEAPRQARQEDDRPEQHAASRSHRHYGSHQLEHAPIP
ncbi:MAG: DUF2442 domain-containing protein [Acetobacteraceae bacterium]|nr:DUF2442 domain-containing protein [Acetobacteraceae bacterium]